MPSGDFVLKFGKHAGKRVADVPTSYLEWMVANLDSRKLKAIAGEQLRERKAAQAAKVVEAPRVVIQPVTRAQPAYPPGCRTDRELAETAYRRVQELKPRIRAAGVIDVRGLPSHRLEYELDRIALKHCDDIPHPYGTHIFPLVSKLDRDLDVVLTDADWDDADTVFDIDDD